MSHVRHEVISATVQRTSTGVVTVPPHMNSLAINTKGTLIIRPSGHGSLVLAPPRSITYVRNSRLIVQAARGEHHLHLISWENRVTPLLYAWMEERHRSRSTVANVRNVACKPIDPYFVVAVDRFEKALQGSNETMEPQMVSFLYDVISRLMVGQNEVQLAAVPADLPETILQLIDKVRKSPASAWPLKEAADMAGYSPFHFSRVFKSLVGYGFHEYVDRCRTECSVDMLVTTDNPVDLVASTCGFGTTQGLRESVKEYLGLVPSELRNVPDSMEFSE